jgi:hypothetical protein
MVPSVIGPQGLGEECTGRVLSGVDGSSLHTSQQESISLSGRTPIAHQVAVSHPAVSLVCHPGTSPNHSSGKPTVNQGMAGFSVSA